MIDIDFMNAVSRTFLDCESETEKNWFAKHLLKKKLESKKWLVDKINDNINSKDCHVLILGSWYPTYLPYLLGSKSYTCVDSDSSVVNLSKTFHHHLGDSDKFEYITMDAKKFLFTTDRKYDIIINTSCEHMTYDMKDVIYDTDAFYAFQSNNYQIEEHVNYKTSIDEFVYSTGLKTILYADTKPLDKYDRYTVIGKL